MTLLTPLALLGLLLLPAVIAMHLRRHQIQSIELPSLLLWEELGGEAASGGKFWRIDRWLLLLLQLIIVCALVLALARPAVTETAQQRVYVLDESALMTVADPAPTRFAAVQRLIRQDIAAAPANTTFVLVAAGGQPQVIVSTADASLAVRDLLAQQPSDATGDLSAALGVAAGIMNPHGHLLVVYANGQTLPPLAAPRGMVSAVAVGTATDDQGLARLTVSCVTGAVHCDAFALIYNGAATPIDEPLSIGADGASLGRQTLHLPARSYTAISFQVPTTSKMLQLYLLRRDLLAADNLAWAAVPSDQPATVTIVGAAALTSALARAFEATPNVHVVVRTPAQFTKSPPHALGLLVLAGWVPSGGLPAAPGLLLVDPPSFQGTAAASLPDKEVISGEDQDNPLLRDVDLTSLDIPPGAAVHVGIAASLTPVVWTPDTTLIAAGVLGGRRTVVMAFDPASSNLSQLSAFPVFIGNVLNWWNNWLPAASQPGQPVAIDVPPSTTAVGVSYVPALGGTAAAQPLTVSGATATFAAARPGIYTVVERGAWGSRTGLVAVSAFAQSALPRQAQPIAIPEPAAAGGEAGPPPHAETWWPWLGVLAGVVLAIEMFFTVAGLPKRL